MMGRVIYGVRGPPRFGISNENKGLLGVLYHLGTLGRLGRGIYAHEKNPETANLRARRAGCPHRPQGKELTMANLNDATRFEAAFVRNGADVDVILRRRSGLAILDHLTPAERVAVETYGATFEAVAAGGVSMPRDGLSAKLAGGSGGAGGPSREGRQSRAVDQAAFLRRMAAGVTSRGRVVAFGKRNPVEVGALTFWHAFAVDGLSVRSALDRFGVKRGPIVNNATVSEVKAMAAAVLAAMGKGGNPMAQ